MDFFVRTYLSSLSIDDLLPYAVCMYRFPCMHAMDDEKAIHSFTLCDTVRPFVICLFIIIAYY